MNNKEKIIVFAPHPDDETWGCGGTIAKRISEGYEVTIVVITDGRYAFSKVLGINSDPTPDELKEIRKEEVKRATRILGVPEEKLVFLDFEDGKLERNEMEAQEKVIEILRENPASVEVYFPYERDYHLDHRVTNRIVRKSIKKLGLHAMIYQYSIAQKYGRIGPLIDIFLNLFRHNMIRVDISEFLPLKEAAVKEFKSEISIISSRQKRPLVDKIGKLLKNEEIFYIDK
ncbi:MAG: PIG-L family deacetylase [Candidatus Bathyarchaeota archaeon]|nr:PIG-L family deacetylase [Candidatus Bathyarchaeota archaeon]